MTKGVFSGLFGGTDKKKSKKSVLEGKQANRKNSREKVQVQKKTSKRSNQEKPRGKQSKGGGKGKTSQKQKAALLPKDAHKPDILPPNLEQNPTPSIESKTPSKESSLAPAFDAVRPPSIATKKREPCVPIEPIVLQPDSLNPVNPPPWANVQKVMSDAKQSKPPTKAPPKQTPEKEAPKKETPEVRPRKAGSKDGKTVDNGQDAKKADAKVDAKPEAKDTKSDGKAAQSQTKSNEPSKESSSNEENKKTAEKAVAAADDDKRRAEENEKKPAVSPAAGSEQGPGGIEIGTLPKGSETDTPTVFEKVACSPRPFASPMKKDGVPTPVEAGKADAADGKDPKSPKEEPPKDDPPVISTYLPTLPAYNIPPDSYQY